MAIVKRKNPSSATFFVKGDRKSLKTITEIQHRLSTKQRDCVPQMIDCGTPDTLHDW